MLGRKATDTITGFSGIITGYCRYLTGCHQVLLVPKALKDGTLPESQWFDEQRLKISRAKAITLDNSKTPGFDKSPPK